MSAKKSAAPADTVPAEPRPEPRADKTRRVMVNHLTRVEGHGNIVVEIGPDGQTSACRWEVPEAPRFFEAMILGRSYQDVHQITSRICGICSIGHQLCSLQATEDALGIQISDQTTMLRKLALHAENLQSHILHLGYLVLPDLFGQPSVIPLAATHKREVGEVVALHRLANEFSRLVCGRTTHPQRLAPGGFLKLPTAAELTQLKKDLKSALGKLQAVVDLFAAKKSCFPDFNRPTEYVGLVSAANEYPLYRGEIGSTSDSRKPTRFYKEIAREYCLPQSTAKWARNVEASYMVGALARFNLNAAKLSPQAKKAAASLGLSAPATNPFYNNLAQLVEVAHSFEDSLELTERLLDRGIRPETPKPVTPRAGQGVSAVEVPRGILFHAYSYDDQGRVVNADCVIPTNQNHGNIQKDFEAITPLLADKSEPEIELTLSMLVRAYDPCISCSTHQIDLDGKNGSRVIFVRTT